MMNRFKINNLVTEFMAMDKTMRKTEAIQLAIQMCQVELINEHLENLNKTVKTISNNLNK